MKKLLNKFRKKNKNVSPSRITNETVAEHRERILAGGRRFKYPIQYARHKLVINTIAISIGALIVLVIVGWWQLYSVQNTSNFMYRITKVVPVPVANVDGQNVLYSDYLMKYLSSVHYLENKEQVNLKTEDGIRQIDYIKKQSMKDSIADAYALKLAKNLKLSISESELDSFLKSQLQSGDGEISQQTYDAVILDYYGWNLSEYRQVTKSKLLRQKVSFAMDDVAQTLANDIKSVLNENNDTVFKDLASKMATQSGIEVTYSVSGWVPKINQDGGLALEAVKLKKNEISSLIKSTIGDGYYIVRLLDLNESQISYEYIKIPLTKFDKSLADVIKNNKVVEYIPLPE